jgi:ribosomal protein L15E
LLQVGIVGIGVLGKTTISQKIFNSKQLVDRFVKRVWVSLSQIVSEEEIMKTMLKQLGQYVNGLDVVTQFWIHQDFLKCYFISIIIYKNPKKIKKKENSKIYFSRVNRIFP